MILQNIKLLLQLYRRPLGGMSQIVDEGRPVFAILAALAVSLIVHIPLQLGSGGNIVLTLSQSSPPARPQPSLPPRPDAPATQEPDEAVEDTHAPRPAAPNGLRQSMDRFLSYDRVSLFAALGAIAILYVPAVILILTLWDSLGGFGTVLRRDYVPLLMCSFCAWTASKLPLAAAAIALLSFRPDLAGNPVLWWFSALYFAVLSVCSFRIVFGTSFFRAIAAAIIGSVVSVFGLALYATHGNFLSIMGSPFILYYLFMYLRPQFSGFGVGLNSRQNLRRHLEAATINPRDADAHYQLGLIYQQRRQFTEAARRFQTAIQIDGTDADAHFQLGRVAREQGRLEDALLSYRKAAAINDKHSSSEVWREIGAVSYLLSRHDEALPALEKYAGRRPYDPEGLYWYGKSLATAGRTEDAKAAFQQSIEAVATMPSHRRGQIKKWSKLSQDELRALAK
jgi:Tfp pilus assembly protein PilF